MNAGYLKDVITILKAQSIRTETGSEDINYIPSIQVRANKYVRKNDREVLNGDVFFPHGVTFRIRRFYDDAYLTENDRIRHKNKDYRILSILPDEPNQCIIIDAELINE